METVNLEANFFQVQMVYSWKCHFVRHLAEALWIQSCLWRLCLSTWAIELVFWSVVETNGSAPYQFLTFFLVFLAQTIHIIMSFPTMIVFCFLSWPYRGEFEPFPVWARGDPCLDLLFLAKLIYFYLYVLKW